MSPQPHTANAYAGLPPVVRLLEIVEPAGAAPALPARLHGDASVQLTSERLAAQSALARLREDNFDAVLVYHDSVVLDAVELVRAIRSGGGDDLPILVVGAENPAEMTPLSFAADADAYLTAAETEPPALLWHVGRAGERRRMLRENRGWRESQSRDASRRRQEVLQQLREQRGMLLDCQRIDDDLVDPLPPAWLVDVFAHLLRTYVVAGRGGLHAEVTHLRARLQNCRVTLREALLAHTSAVEQLVLGLGNRGAWHAVGRGNLLVFELILQWMEASGAAVHDATAPADEIGTPGLAHGLT